MKIYVVGLGPGEQDQLTFKAVQVLKSCDVIAGYTVYIDLIKNIFPDKIFVTTPMKKEIERCNMAIEKMIEGYKVAVVSSGDAGIYGMAGLLHETAQRFEESKKLKEKIEIEVIPGITAACSGGAILGAPLTHDFSVISLSDLLTPWEKIEKRIKAAAEADFVICLYNPASRKRSDYLARACSIIRRYQRSDLPVGIVRNIGRENQSFRIMTLAELKETKVDMFTTVFIGNSQTRIINGKMITPRGYGNNG